MEQWLIGMGSLFRVMKMSRSYTLVMASELCEHANATEFKSL
jgi:hypothetical protein